MRNTRVVGQMAQLKLFVSRVLEAETVYYVCPTGSCVGLVNGFLLECGVTDECHQMMCFDGVQRNLLRLEPDVLWKLICKQAGNHQYQFGLFYTNPAEDKPREVSYDSLFVPPKRKSSRRHARRPGIIAKLLEIPGMIRAMDLPPPSQPKVDQSKSGRPQAHQVRVGV